MFTWKIRIVIFRCAVHTCSVCVTVSRGSIRQQITRYCTCSQQLEVCKNYCLTVETAFLLILVFSLVSRRFMIQRPSGEQLQKVQSKHVRHCLQQDGYNCGIYVIKVSAQTMLLLLLLLLRCATARLYASITNIEYFFNSSHQKSFATATNKPELCNKQCTLQTALVDLAN